MPKYIIFFMIVPWLPLTLVSVSVAGARHWTTIQKDWPGKAARKWNLGIVPIKTPARTPGFMVALVIQDPQGPAFANGKALMMWTAPCSWTHSVEQCRVWVRAQDLVLLWTAPQWRGSSLGDALDGLLGTVCSAFLFIVFFDEQEKQQSTWEYSL